MNILWKGYERTTEVVSMYIGKIESIIKAVNNIARLIMQHPYSQRMFPSCLP